MAWHARTLNDDFLSDFVARLEEDVYAEAVEFDPSDGLTLDEGRLVALVFHPDLRMARLGVARAMAGREHAGTWTDPELSISVLRITDSVLSRWVVTPSLTFSIPLSGRLSAEEDLATAEERVAEQHAREAEWEVWRNVEQAWFAWSAIHLRAEETERLTDALETLVEVTERLAQQGELRRTEAALFAVEQAQRRSQLRRLRGEAAAAEQRLRAQLGLAPETPVDLLPSLALPSSTTEDLNIGEQIAARNPSLARLRLEYDVAEARLRREIAKQYPDLTLGPQYESDQGQSRIGLVGGIPLPLLNANTRAIAEARIDREIARAAFETRYETLVGQWAARTTRSEALTAQRADLETTLLPLVERQVADSLQLLQLGEGTSLVLLESLSRAHEAKIELIDTRTSQAQERADLAHIRGPAAAATARETEAPETPRPHAGVDSMEQPR